ncbi:MAG: oligosaccharide flippase family protein, partial [Candidatus Hermodarchaeota archaeon]
GAIIVFLSILSFIFLSFYLFITPFVAELYQRPYLVEYMILLSPAIFLNSFTLFFARILIALNSYRKALINRISDGVFYLVGILFMTSVYGWTVKGMVLGTLIYSFAYTIGLIILVYSELRKQKIHVRFIIERTYLWELTNLGKYYFASNSFYDFLRKLDETILPLFVSNRLFGYYTFAKKLLLRLRFLFARLSSMLYPTFSELSETTGLENVRKFLSRGISFSLFYIVLISQLLFIFSQELIWGVSILLIDISEFLPTAPLIAIFSFVLIAEAIRVVIFAYHAGLGKVRVILKANIIGFLVGLLLIPLFTVYFDIYGYGIYGSAIAYVLANFAITLWFLYETNKNEVALSKTKILLRLCGGFLEAGMIRILYDMLLLNIGFFQEDQVRIITIMVLSLFYVFLDFTVMSFLNVLTYEEILLLEKIAGSNRLIKKVVNVVKSLYKISNRTQIVERNSL